MDERPAGQQQRLPRARRHRRLGARAGLAADARDHGEEAGVARSAELNPGAGKRLSRPQDCAKDGKTASPALSASEISRKSPRKLRVCFKPFIAVAATYAANRLSRRGLYHPRGQQFRPTLRSCAPGRHARPRRRLTMSERVHTVPLSSFIEGERRARIKRTLVIEACVRGTLRSEEHT